MSDRSAERSTAGSQIALPCGRDRFAHAGTGRCRRSWSATRPSAPRSGPSNTSAVIRGSIAWQLGSRPRSAELDAPRLGAAHRLAGDAVRLAERQAERAHQPVREIGGGGVTDRGGGREPRSGSMRHAGDHSGHRRQAKGQAVGGIEHRLLVLLQVLAVGERQALEDDQQRVEVCRSPGRSWPRTSSAASGLRFCGMIELPLENSSAIRTKANCGVDQRTSSSARRDRWTAAIAAAARNSRAKSRSETASIELAMGRAKPSSAAVAARSIGKLVPASAAAPERAFVQPGAGIGEAAAVAPEHLDVGQQMVAEGDRLGRLQMGEARHHERGVLLRARRAAPPAGPGAGRQVRSIASRTQSRTSVAT